jgi:hypothetical protein
MLLVLGKCKTLSELLICTQPRKGEWVVVLMKAYRAIVSCMITTHLSCGPLAMAIDLRIVLVRREDTNHSPLISGA